MWFSMLLVLIMMLGLYVFINGLKKQSQFQLFIGGLGLMAPVFFFIKLPGLLPIVPIIALLISMYTVKKIKKEE